MPGELLWEPSVDLVERSNLTAFRNWLASEKGLEFAGYDDLWEWSTTDLDGFWAAIWDFTGVVCSRPYERILSSREMPGAEWFPGARLNYAENVFEGHDDDAVAIVHASESSAAAELRWGELRSAVAAAAAGLRDLGVGRGDRVVAYLPNVPETIIGFLATASIGAIWSSCSPDFGTRTVVNRFAQIEPKVMIAVDGYRYGGKEFDRTEALDQLVRAMPTLESVVLVPRKDRLEKVTNGEPGTLGDRLGVIDWRDLLAVDDRSDLEFEQVGSSDPLWVLYSSGTTGLPKAIVQSHGGILLEHKKTHNLHLDLQSGDRYMWFTTTGWMMWNFLVSGLLTEAAIVLYDGNPGYPDLSRLWDLAAETGVTCFGTSASYISGCMKAGVVPGEGRDLSKLKAVGSTGSPLVPEGFDWIFDQLGHDTWLFSASGGTDVCTAFIGGVPWLPVYRGELQGRALGSRLEAWNDEGEPVIGEVGELVLTEPLPSMPVYLWGDDPEMTRYRESYFEPFPGIWRHGDWIEITERGTGIIYGRSDSTINRGGIRMGTSEIYRAILAMPEILDALVVDIPREGTEGWIPLFVVPAEGVEIDDDLRSRIADRVRRDCSPRHVPNEVFEVSEIPRTLTGKILEVPVKRILMGMPVAKAASRDSLENPDSLDYFVELSKTLG